MRNRRVTSLLATSAALLLIATHRAEAAPAPVTPLKLSTHILEHPIGLANASSKPAAGGLAGLDASQVAEYAKSLTALNLTAEYHADANAPSTTIGSGNTAVTLQQGADIKLTASVSKKDGQDSASLDSLELDASGVKFGPSINLGPIHTGPLLSLSKVTIDSQGDISVKLNKWIPTVTINRIEHLSNGDTVLHSSNWWMPPVTIKANGDVTTTIGIGPFSITKTLGHLNFNAGPVLANWPPTVAELASGGIVAALEGMSGGKSGSPASTAISQLAGTVDWSLSASAHDPKVSLDGASTDATVNVALTGEGHLANGDLKTTGDNNKIHVDVSLAGTSVSTAKAAIALHDAKASLDGTYSLDMPLADSKHMVVAFSGRAAVSGNGTSATLALPDGAKVSVGARSPSPTRATSTSRRTRAGTNRPHERSVLGAGDRSDPGQRAHRRPGLDINLAGNVSSAGTIAQTANGLAIKANLNGTETTTSDTTVALANGGTTTLKKGSQVNVALGDLEASVNENDPTHPTATVQGSVESSPTWATSRSSRTATRSTWPRARSRRRSAVRRASRTASSRAPATRRPAPRLSSETRRSTSTASRLRSRSARPPSTFPRSPATSTSPRARSTAARRPTSPSTAAS